MYRIKILKTAHIDCANSVIFKNGNSQECTKIGCHCFLLEKDDCYYLIDTGIENVDVANKTKSSKSDWGRDTHEHTVKENLLLLGVECNQISKIFLTHSHYDHISGIVHFPNAEIYMTRAEYELLYAENNPLREYLDEVKIFLKNKKVVLVDEELTVDEIKLKLLGGHTAGSMSVEVNDMLFAGDTVFTQENIDKAIPAGFTADRKRSDELIEIYCNYNGRIITSHDYEEEV